MTEPTKRKVSYQELFDKFKIQADQWLTDTPEARTMMLVVDWEVGKNDFPAAHVVALNSPTDKSILDSMTQALKLVDYLSSLYKQNITAAQSTLKQAEELLKQRKSE